MLGAVVTRTTYEELEPLLFKERVSLFVDQVGSLREYSIKRCPN
jgi:hypothetical protein